MNTPVPTHIPVLIAGGGPVGLTLAALLGAYGIRTLVVEADPSYCTGSRAICISRRSQEILGWVGADKALADKALPWTGGRSYYRDAEVLHFRMASDPTERFAPMVNIQQFYVEEFADRAAKSDLVEVRWSSKVVEVAPQEHGAEVVIEDADGSRHRITADWLVACDGGRSTVRERLGLEFEGMQYDGRYVIVDIEQATQRSVERLAWFDPPSNRGSTILMHRQPDDIWRIDYQIRDDEDPAEAVKPENVLPRVQSHLDMIGETAPWKALWISIYNAKCLTLNDYRHGRVLFAGDAAHLVPIFGVRGLNSGLDDAGNLAWKLALVLQGQAPATLLDSFSQERVHATRQNLAYGAKSTEFMAPPHFGFSLMREAALRLALENETVRSLINPRQSTPISYAGSALNAGDASPVDSRIVAAGDPAAEALLRQQQGEGHLSRRFGHGFVVLYFSDEPSMPAWLVALAAQDAHAPSLARLTLLRIASQSASQSASHTDDGSLFDSRGEAWQRYAATPGTLILIRPDGYVLGRWAHADAEQVTAALAPFRAGAHAAR